MSLWSSVCPKKMGATKMNNSLSRPTPVYIYNAEVPADIRRLSSGLTDKSLWRHFDDVRTFAKHCLASVGVQNLEPTDLEH